MLAETAANDVLDDLYGSGTPATIYIGLFTSAPAADGTGGTEVSGPGYARIGITNNNTEWPDAVDSTKSNANPIVFPTATGNWGAVTHAMAFDALTSGNRYDWAALASPKTVNNGDTFSIGAEQFIITT